MLFLLASVRSKTFAGVLVCRLSVFGFIGFMFMPIPFFLFFFGKRLREGSRYSALSLKEKMEMRTSSADEA